jgi:acetoin utilization deacetylase AcuC-like enzyme
MSNKRVAYFYKDEIGNFNYGSDHPMKPKRIAMTHELIVSYGMYPKMDVYRPHYATRAEMGFFHGLDYVKFVECSAKKMNLV